MHLKDDYFLTIPLVDQWDISKLNQKHKMFMIQEYQKFLETKNPNTPVYNTFYDNEEYNNRVSEVFCDIIDSYFDINCNINEIKTWIYCQTDEIHAPYWHDHASTTKISATYYINAPNHLGGLELNWHNKKMSIPVRDNFMYIFPSTLRHRPEPQLSDAWRICVNLEYNY